MTVLIEFLSREFIISFIEYAKTKVSKTEKSKNGKREPEIF